MRKNSFTKAFIRRFLYLYLITPILIILSCLIRTGFLKDIYYTEVQSVMYCIFCSMVLLSSFLCYHNKTAGIYGIAGPTGVLCFINAAYKGFLLRYSLINSIIFIITAVYSFIYLTNADKKEF
ncbi:hypothetical protein [Clostridium polynesiense]|uniref:hypothetical protein n=1 Tax=Clostridium polynesiense TaxID=1325933 RepID=UPI00058D1431|nr:hypothetical protein [Clostridium polynesiense]